MFTALTGLKLKTCCIKEDFRLIVVLYSQHSVNDCDDDNNGTDNVETPEQNNLVKAGREEEKLTNSSENMLKLVGCFVGKLLKNVTNSTRHNYRPFLTYFSNKCLY
jgi:hypothetical protein